jgi:ribonuclease Z
MGRENPLHLYAPEKYESILKSHLNDFDINLSFEIDFIPLAGNDPVKILDDKYLSVTSFPLQHRIPAYGFLFREKISERNIIKECIDKFQIPVVRIPAIKKGEDFITADGTVIKNEEITVPPTEPLSYAYCSDTKYFKRLASFVKGVSLLYHEATFDKTKEELALMTGHSTTLDAAKTALNAKVKALIIGHFSARYRNVEELVEEARTIFPETYPAIDGKTFEVGNISAKE